MTSKRIIMRFLNEQQRIAYVLSGLLQYLPIFAVNMEIRCSEILKSS